ncbi:MAG: pyridoxamine 5'-phosphate oxidase family protein [Dehalococcoidia bacterium]
MIGALDPDEIERLLRTQHIGRLGVLADGRVYVFPVAYGYDGASINIHSHEGLKVRAMRAYPEACFEVEEIISPANWRTVIAHGRFEELTGESDRDAALALIAAQGQTPFPPSAAPYAEGADHLIVFRLHLTEKTGRYERDEVFPQRLLH